MFAFYKSKASGGGLSHHKNVQQQEQPWPCLRIIDRWFGVPEGGVTQHPVAPHLDTRHQLVEVVVKQPAGVVLGLYVGTEEGGELWGQQGKHLQALLYSVLL